MLPHERTTPAGRFVAKRGGNLAGEDVVWVDYDAAVSVPAEFFEAFVLPSVAGRPAIVYVMPETRAAQPVFGSYDVAARHGANSTVRHRTDVGSPSVDNRLIAARSRAAPKGNP